MCGSPCHSKWTHRGPLVLPVRRHGPRRMQQRIQNRRPRRGLLFFSQLTQFILRCGVCPIRPFPPSRNAWISTSAPRELPSASRRPPSARISPADIRVTVSRVTNPNSVCFLLYYQTSLFSLYRSNPSCPILHHRLVGRPAFFQWLVCHPAGPRQIAHFHFPRS